MRKYQNSVILILLIGIGGLLFFINQKETETPKGKLIQHFKRAEVINPEQGAKFHSSWFDASYQVIVFAQNLSEYSILNFDWNPYFENNPEIKFIFYYSGKDKSKIETWMKETGFQRPILYDPAKTFYNQNVVGDTNGIVFNTKNGIVQFLENPSFPNYQDFLDELKE
jgi:hypothetical protein